MKYKSPGFRRGFCWRAAHVRAPNAADIVSGVSKALNFGHQVRHGNVVVGRNALQAAPAAPPAPAHASPMAETSPAIRKYELVRTRLQAVFLHFAIKRRAPDIEPFRHFRHVAAVAPER